MSKLFKDNIFSGKTKNNRFGEIEKEVKEKHFKNWIEEFIDDSKSLALHNIKSYKVEPITLIFDDPKIQLPFNIFRNSPATIRYIETEIDKPVSIVLQSPSVLYKDTSRKTYVITGNDINLIELLDIKCDIESITIISAFDTCETFNRLLTNFLSKYSSAKINVNYTSKILDDSYTSIAAYIMNSIYKDTVNIQFEDCGVLLDNSLTTIQDEDLVFIKGE